MSERYRVKLSHPQTTKIIVVANSHEEASESALRGEGKPGNSRYEEPRVIRDP